MRCVKNVRYLNVMSYVGYMSYISHMSIFMNRLKQLFFHS